MKHKLLLFSIAAIALSACEFAGTSSTSFSSSNNSIESSEHSSISIDSNNSEASSNSSNSSSSSASSSSKTTTSRIRLSSSFSSTSSTSSKLSSNTSSKQPSSDSNWNVNFNETGATFRETLRAEMARKKTKTTTYNNCLELGAAAARDPNSTTQFVPIYHPSNELTTVGACNREHMWPNSRGSGKTGPGADPFIIRPSLTKENSDRGNDFYGTEKSNEWDPASCTNGNFLAARGEAARVILYAAVLYYKSHSFVLTNNPSDDWNKIHSMGTLKFLIRWNNEYAPTDTEIRINNYLSSQGYGRNPFVDHPEYANYIWDENGLIGESSNSNLNLKPDYELDNAFGDISNMQKTVSYNIVS